MIYVSSKAGQRLAKAEAARKSAVEALRKHLSEAQDPQTYLARVRDPVSEEADAARYEWEAAAKALAAELIADRHHEAEGD